MRDYLVTIRKVIEEHQAIREHIKLVGDSMGDQEAISRLQSAGTDWFPGQSKAPTETQKKTQQALTALDEGLKSHFTFEEEVLPPLLGELLMKALLLEHQEIITEIIEAKSVVDEIKLEGLNHEELLNKASNLQQKVGNTCFMIEEHANREEILLDMLQRSLVHK